MKLRNTAGLATGAVLAMSAVLASGGLAQADTAPPTALCTTQPSVSINDVTKSEEGNSNLLGHQAIFTATLSARPCKDVTVDFKTHDGTAKAGSDYVAGNGTATFSAAQGHTKAWIMVTMKDDGSCEGNEHFWVNLSNPQNAGVSDPWGLGTITENGGDCLY